jgi:hypothetical protein
VIALLMRRWWVLAACGLLAAAGALVITALRPAPYVASAYVAVPVGAAADVGDRNAQALAIAQALGSDAAVASSAGGDLQVIGTEDTTQIELRVQADSAAKAVAGARLAARSVVDAGTAAVPAGSLVVLELPETATLDGAAPAEAAVVAALLGLVAGGIGVVWRHRAHDDDLGSAK